MVENNAKAKAAEELARKNALSFAIGNFNDSIFAFKNSTADLDPEYSLQNKDNPNIDIYTDTQFGNIHGMKLTAKEAAEKYKIEGGEDRVNEIVEGINRGIEEFAAQEGTELFRKIIADTPGNLESARAKYKELTEPKE